jgi:hypothetical protein
VQVVIVIKQPKYGRGSGNNYIDAFLDLRQHVLASHCHHQEVKGFLRSYSNILYCSYISIRSVQSGQLPRCDVVMDSPTTHLDILGSRLNVNVIPNSFPLISPLSLQISDNGSCTPFLIPMSDLDPYTSSWLHF